MKNVLIVDDSSTILMSMEQILTKEGLGVTKATSGEDALKKSQGGGKFDLVITDINMPGMSGLELIKNLKTQSNMRFVPILVLTTEYDQSKKDEAKKMGATGWMVKPVKGGELLAVVKKVLPGALA